MYRYNEALTVLSHVCASLVSVTSYVRQTLVVQNTMFFFQIDQPIRVFQFVFIISAVFPNSDILFRLQKVTTKIKTLYTNRIE